MGIGRRYMDRDGGMLEGDDYENGVKVLREVMKRVDEKRVEEIT